jgi:hypothetical protein
MQFVKLDDNPKLIDVINKIHSEPWPRFLNESAIIKKYWRKPSVSVLIKGQLGIYRIGQYLSHLLEWRDRQSADRI